MDSITEIMQLCRLCLVKEEVNIPIFGEHGDIRHIFLKISACLPVKISKEDNLPKKICDGCSCKLEMLYRFWNTSVNSEKKLIQWLEQIGAEETSDKGDIANTNSLNTQHSISSNPVVLKQEVVELTDTQSAGEDLIPDLKVPSDEQDYLMQSQQLPYQSVEFQFQQDGFDTVIAEEESSNIETETQPKQRKRRAAAMKALASMESEGEDDPDLINTKIAKTEEESDDSAGEDPEPTTFVGIPSADDEQPGPSGIGKPSNDAPIKREIIEEDTPSTIRFLNQCGICLEIFSRDDHLKKHMTVHGEERPYSCDVCLKAFKTKYVLKFHKKRLHGTVERHQCDMCNKYVKSRKQLERHQNRHLNNFSTFCEVCKKGFFNVSDLKIHVLREHEKVVSKCTICGKSLANDYYLKRHMQIHSDTYLSDKKHKCHLCDKSYLFKTSLIVHMKSHTGENVRVCYICGKKVLSRNGLEDHLLLHQGVRPHKCHLCDKSFARQDYLKVHVRSHTGVKPYKCETCTKSFTQRSSLVIHMRHHTGEKPYACDLCDGSFVSKSLLNVHKKTKHLVS